MRIFDFFKKTNPVTVVDLVSILKDKQTDKKALKIMQNFLKSPPPLTRSDADRIFAAITPIKKTDIDHNTNQPWLLTAVKMKSWFSSFSLFLSNDEKKEQLKLKIANTCQAVIIRDYTVINHAKVCYPSIDSINLTEFKGKLTEKFNELGLTDLDKILIIKNLRETIFNKFPIGKYYGFLEHLSSLIDKLVIKDPQENKILDSLKEDSIYISKIQSQGSLNLNNIAKSPMLTRFFIKVNIADGKFDMIQRLKEKFEFLGCEFCPFEAQFNMLKSVIEKGNEIDQKSTFIRHGKVVLDQKKYFPNQLIPQEAAILVRNSNKFSSCLLRDIEESITYAAKLPDEILSDIEILLGQSPSALVDLDFSKVEAFLQKCTLTDVGPFNLEVQHLSIR